MPDQLINQEWKNFVSHTSIHSPCSVYELPDTFPQLAQKFKVTADCLLVRLNFLGYIKLPDGFWGKIRQRK